MGLNNWPDTYRSDEPVAGDTRFRRVVVEIRRPIAFIENMLELVLICGHKPLCSGAAEVGDDSFCPDCCEEARTYQLIQGADGPAAIKCRRCGRTSYHPDDIAQLYCGKCHQFHEKL